MIRSARDGNGAAFAELIRPEYLPALRLACGLLHDPNDAEDAVQEAAFTAWRKLRNLRPGWSLRPWFLAIVANQCRAVAARRRWSEFAPAQPHERGASVDLVPGIDLRRALARLGHEQRLVLILRYYLDLPFEDIAATLGISPKAARTRVERAVRRLRPILQLQEALT